MPKKVNDALEFVNKFIGMFLVAIMTGMFTLNNSVGSIKTATEDNAKILSGLQSTVSHVNDRVIEIDTVQTLMVMELNDVKMSNDEMREEQLLRTPDVKCANKIRNTIGCDIPKSHAELYK